MPSFAARLEAELGPAWGAMVGALGALYATWPVLSLHDTLVVKGGGGVGWFLVIIYGFIAYAVTLAIGGTLLGVVFHRLENQAVRGVISLVLIAIFLAARGVPHPLWLVLVAAIGASSYVQCRKSQTDAGDEEEFSIDARPRRVDVDDGYLGRFADPLWDRLDLENCKALSAIEGERDGSRFVILELQHSRLGLLAGDGARDITTFFIAAIPQSVAGRHVSWHPTGYQASADGMHVYVARPGTQARPGEWKGLVQATLRTAASLNTRAELGRTAPGARASGRPVRPGAGGHVFWAVVSLGFAALLMVCGVGTMFGWIDYRPDCFPDAAAAECMTVWRVEKAFMEGLKYLLGGGVFLGGAWYHRERARKRLTGSSKKGRPRG